MTLKDPYIIEGFYFYFFVLRLIWKALTFYSCLASGGFFYWISPRMKHHCNILIMAIRNNANKCILAVITGQLLQTVILLKICFLLFSFICLYFFYIYKKRLSFWHIISLDFVFCLRELCQTFCMSVYPRQFQYVFLTLRWLLKHTGLHSYLP